MSYRPHEDFIAPARPKSEAWRTIGGYLLIEVAHMGLIVAAFSVLGAAVGDIRAQATFEAIFNSPLTAAESLLFLASFAFLGIAVILVTRHVHQRSALTLLGPVGPALAQFWVVMKALVALQFALIVVLPDGDIEMVRNLPVSTWLVYLPLAVPVILMQTAAEEAVFRGYLQQQLAARFRHPIIWMGLPSAMFAMGHFQLNDPDGFNMVLWSFSFAVVAADLTARSGTLGPAIALHFVNNAMAILYAALPGPVSGLSLFHYALPYGDRVTDSLIVVDLGILFVSWLAARVAIRA